MCEPISHKEEKDCLIKTIESVLKSIEAGEKKLRKIFKDGSNNDTKNKRSTSKD